MIDARVRVLCLQTADAVLEEQRDGTVVAVLARPRRAFHFELVGLDARVVKQSKRVPLLVALVGKELSIESKPDGDGGHDLHVELVSRRLEGEHGVFELGHIALCRPLVLHTGSWSLPISSDSL